MHVMVRQVSRMGRKEAINILSLRRQNAIGTLGNLPREANYTAKNVLVDEISAYDMAIEALKEPERKKGQWEDFDYDNSYLCTSCGEIWTLNDGTPEENNMNYCPNCGADMRGEKVDKKRSDRNIKEK